MNIFILYNSITTNTHFSEGFCCSRFTFPGATGFLGVRQEDATSHVRICTTGQVQQLLNLNISLSATYNT